MNTDSITYQYNSGLNPDQLKIVLALEPEWTVSLDNFDFQTLNSADISVEGDCIRMGKWTRRIRSVEWLPRNAVRIRCRARTRAHEDVFILYAAAHLPAGADLRRKRRAFQVQLGRALGDYYNIRIPQKQVLHSDRIHGIGGAYPRFLIGTRAVIGVDPDESSATINAVMRAAFVWAPLVGRRLSVVVPKHRGQTIRRRLATMPVFQRMFDWLEWDGERLTAAMASDEAPHTFVHMFQMPEAWDEVQKVLATSPQPLEAVLNVAASAVSIRFRGIEVALVRSGYTTYPLGEPVGDIVRDLAEIRRHGSNHPLARAHEERWLESKLVGDIRRLLPSIDHNHVYPQVPSFIDEERNIIDLLTVTRGGRLVVLELKASADPDLPLQGLDYWIAVERHRKAGNFQRNGYFNGLQLIDEPALLVLVAPLLAFHKTFRRVVEMFPSNLPLMEVGLNQAWKKEIKILRRKGPVS